MRSLATKVEAIAEFTSRIAHTVADLPDGRIVMSFPRTGRINAAQSLAEFGDVRARFPTESQLAAEAGVCPLNASGVQPHASGKSRGVVFRFACNHRLRATVTCWAGNSRHACACAAQIHAKVRGRGCGHPHAVRILARAWLRILWKAWTERQTYDPTRHGSAARLAP